MSCFVWLTRSSSQCKVRVLVDISKAISIEPYNNGSIVNFTADHYETFDETIETIANILGKHNLL